MSLSSIGGGASLYSAPQHGPGCPCPACQQKRADTTASSAGDNASNSSGVAAGGSPVLASNGKALNQDQQKQVAALQARDTDVRRHEAAHQAAGGALAGAASFSYQQGPDGKQYAVGGEVSIQMGQGSTPQQTIQNAQTVRAAALAPADPSGQDRAVAAQATQMEQQARMQLRQQQAGGQPLSPLQQSQDANAPAGSKTGLGQSVDTYA